MKNLLILRHATSASQGVDGTDFSRPLVAQGINEASIQGRFLKEAGIIPTQIASSNAHRARQTTEALVDSLGGTPEPVYYEELYNAPGSVILQTIASLSENGDTTLVVAHMPGVAELLDILTTDFAEVAVAFTPATMAGVSFRNLASWSDLQPNSGTLEWLLPPILILD